MAKEDIQEALERIGKRVNEIENELVGLREHLKNAESPEEKKDIYEMIKATVRRKISLQKRQKALFDRAFKRGMRQKGKRKKHGTPPRRKPTHRRRPR